jgi:hypothetical protein
MEEFLMLIAQILLITCIQTVAELFIDSSKNPMQVKLIGIACTVGCFYLLVQFVFSYVLEEIIGIINLPL